MKNKGNFVRVLNASGIQMSSIQMGTPFEKKDLRPGL
jgi:hypothetical protein